MRRWVIVLVVLAMTAVSCGDGDAGDTTTTFPATVAPPPTTGGPITTEPSSATEQEVMTFLAEFMQARDRGSGAEAFLSRNAADLFEASDALALYEPMDAYEVTSLERADADSFVATCRILIGDRTIDEGVGVGPGEDLDGRLRPLVVRFVTLERVEVAETTTLAPTTTTSPATTSTTTAVATSFTIDELVAREQRRLDEAFAANPDKPAGVLGALLIVCDEHGPVGFGDVFACAGRPRTEPGFELDPVGMVFAVVDDDGTLAWVSGTDIMDDTSWVMDGYRLTGSGLLCADLREEGVAAYPFAVYGSTPAGAYFWSLVYWFLDGQPERMDADRDGIPCETLYPDDVVTAVWAGGPAG